MSLPKESDLHTAGLCGDGVHDDTAAIQRLLDSCGTVCLPAGTFLVTRPLKIHDRTRFVLDAGSTVFLADGANCAIIENDRFDERGILLRHAPRNAHISIEGGVWDGNNAGQVRWPEEDQNRLTAFKDDCYYGILMRFIGIDFFTMSNTVVKDPESYAVQIADAENFTFRDIDFDFNCLRLNMDGIHVNGPARFGHISNIKGRTNDDMVALNCDDGYPVEISRGPISHITVDGLYCDCGYNAVRLLSCGSALSDIAIRNIFGTYRYYAVSFTYENIHGDPTERCDIDNILLDGIFVSKATHLLSERGFDYSRDALEYLESAPLICFDWGSKAGHVTIRNLRRVETNAAPAPTVQVRRGGSVARLHLCDISQRFPGQTPIPLLVNDGHIGEIETERTWPADSTMQPEE